MTQIKAARLSATEASSLEVAGSSKEESVELGPMRNPCLESYFISDIHLKSMEERSGKTLLRFLASLKEKRLEEVQLFFLGDIFDLWVSDGRVFINKYKDLVDLLSELVRGGMRGFFFEGNHDLHIDPYWEKVIGFKVYVDPQYIDIEGSMFRIEHGDLINLEDQSYLKLRNFLRDPRVEWVGHRVPGWVWDKIGELWSPRSRKRSEPFRRKNEEQLRSMIRLHAHRSFNERPFDFILTGHMHVYDDYEFVMGDKKARSINLGSWFDGPKILRFKNQELSLLEM